LFLKLFIGARIIVLDCLVASSFFSSVRRYVEGGSIFQANSRYMLDVEDFCSYSHASE